MLCSTYIIQETVKFLVKCDLLKLLEYNNVSGWKQGYMRWNYGQAWLKVCMDVYMLSVGNWSKFIPTVFQLICVGCVRGYFVLDSEIRRPCSEYQASSDGGCISGRQETRGGWVWCLLRGGEFVLWAGSCQYGQVRHNLLCTWCLGTYVASSKHRHQNSP